MSEYLYTTDPENKRKNGKNKGKGKSILVHRLVWREKFGKIPKDFIIHHKNGNKKDNRIENLECISKSDHRKKHL